MPKEERQIKEITDNDLDTGRDLVTENYQLEILTLKDKVDLRRFSKSFLKIDKLLKNAFTGIAGHIATKVSQITDGHMSKEDKIKLDNIANNANNYLLPVANSNILGGVKIGNGINIDNSGAISIIPVREGLVPIGALLLLDNANNPATLYPGTTWLKIESRFLYASSISGATGGRSSVSLVVANIPSHTHSASQGAHNHTANHNHSASQSAHAHTQPTHTHSISRPRRIGSSGVNNDSGWSGDTGSSGTVAYGSSSNGGENTGSAQPTITVNTANVTTSNATPSITIGSVGSGTAFDIMPPYYTICVWKRLS